MTRQELKQKIAKKTGISNVIVGEIIEETFNEIMEAVQNHDTCEFRGFGTFSAKHRKEKTARDIKNGRTIIVPARYKPFFKPSPDFSEGVK